MASAPEVIEAAGRLAAPAALALAILVFALVLARLARRPRRERHRRKTFAAGREAALRRPPRFHDEALARLGEGDAGKLAGVRGAPGDVLVLVQPRRADGCERAAGVLAGLFEAAWASDVDVHHVACGRKSRGPCEYVVRRRRVNAVGRRAAGASIPGS